MQLPPYVIFPAYVDDSFNCKVDEIVVVIQCCPGFWGHFL